MSGRHMIRAGLAAFSCATLVCACLCSEGVQAAQEKQETARKEASLPDLSDYRKWAKANPKPLLLPAPLDALCMSPSGAQLIETSANPHRKKYFTVYVNDTGKSALLGKETPRFPVGSVLLKEKTVKVGGAPELMTVMVKRDKGYDPKGGDWEYLVRNGATGKNETRGKLGNCRSCHAMKRDSDFVFRSYLPGGARRLPKWASRKMSLRDGKTDGMERPIAIR